MNLEGLIKEFRRVTDDRVEPYRTSDEDLGELATEAEREACVRARLIFDDTITVTLAAGEHTKPLPAQVDRLTYASFRADAGGSAAELAFKGLDWIREQCDWDTRSCSRPRVLAELATPRRLRIWPTPSVAGTLTLSAYRYPLQPLEDPGDEPEIPEEHHRGLVDWMVYRALTTKEPDSEDTPRAKHALESFVERFGERPSADVLRRHRERRRVTTRCHD